MIKRLRSWIRGSSWYNYNQVARDRWVASEASHVPAGAVVLDVGAGSAPYRTLFSHCTYQTQDFSQLQPDQLRGLQGYAQITYVCDATRIPVPAATFDLVLCTEMLEHVPEPVEVIRELARVLKPQGTLLLTAPLGSALHQEPFHFYGGYTPYWYQRFLAEQGFVDIQCTANGGFYRLYGQETIRLSRLLSPHRHPLWLSPLVLALWLPACLAAIALPPLCVLLDRLDPISQFTCGYHVRARRGEGTSAVAAG